MFFHFAPQLILRCHPSSRTAAALIALYHAAGGPNWTRNDNWLSGAPIGDWFGVTTDDTGRVTRLEISGNQLIGEIPSELGSLSNLRALYLSDNQLTGEIPEELTNLSSLESLHLGSNQLVWEIPVRLGNLFDLRVLDLGINRLSGEIPEELGDLSNLEELVLSDNQLRGNIPGEAGQPLQPEKTGTREQPVGLGRYRRSSAAYSACKGWTLVTTG